MIIFYRNESNAELVQVMLEGGTRAGECPVYDSLRLSPRVSTATPTSRRIRNFISEQ